MAKGDAGSIAVTAHGVSVYSGSGSIAVLDASNGIEGYKHNLNASGKSYVMIWF